MRGTMFKKKTYQPVSDAPFLPSGIVVEAEDKWYYLKSKSKRPIASRRVLESWGLPVLKCNYKAISKLVTLGPLGFRDGTVIKSIVNGRIYIISEGKRRQITNPDWLTWLQIGNPVLVSAEEELLNDVGDDLD